jgi:hypothetical protein
MEQLKATATDLDKRLALCDSSTLKGSTTPALQRCVAAATRGAGLAGG